MGYRKRATSHVETCLSTRLVAVYDAHQCKSWEFLIATYKVRRCAFARRLLSLKAVPFCMKGKERWKTLLLDFALFKMDAMLSHI